MTTIDQPTEQTTYRENQISRLREIYQGNGRRKAAYLFIQACPRTDWVFLVDELERLIAEKYKG